MKYEDIKMFHERCAEKFCVIRLSMTTNMLMDEIEELRTYIEEKETITTKKDNTKDKYKDGFAAEFNKLKCDNCGEIQFYKNARHTCTPKEVK